MNRIIMLGAVLLLQNGAISAGSSVDYTTFIGYSKPSGGAGGSEVTVTSAGQLTSAASSSGKKVIKMIRVRRNCR